MIEGRATKDLYQCVKGRLEGMRGLGNKSLLSPYSWCYSTAPADGERERDGMEDRELGL